MFGCWTSVSRKSVLPVFEETNGLLFYPVQYEGEELSKNASLCPDRILLDRVRLAADRFQCELRTRAVEAAQRIYRRTPRGYVRRVAQAWNVWRHSTGSRTRRQAA